MAELPKMKIWSCKIGEVDPGKLPDGADWPMRSAVQMAYREITGEDASFTFSGWGARLDEGERAVVENRKPIDSNFYAHDAVHILRSNGTTEHADGVAALIAELELARILITALRAELEGAAKDFEAFVADTDIVEQQPTEMHLGDGMLTEYHPTFGDLRRASARRESILKLLGDVK